MRFETARDAIKHAQSFHVQLCEFYSFLATQEITQRVALLLDYMIQHEKKLAGSLHDYEKNTRAGILDTWLQFTNDLNILTIPKTEDLPSTHSLEDIVELSMKFSDELIEVYTQIAEQADESQLKEIFTHLAQNQTQAKKLLSTNIDRFMDI
jgi:nitrogenase subunit NifH